MPRIPSHLRRLATTLVQDEQGGEVLEYALILGIVIVVTIVTVQGFGGKVMARWTSLNSSM